MSAAQRADLVVRGVDWLITVDPTRRVIRDAAVAVKGGKFVAIGKTAEVQKAWNADTVIEGKGMVGTPGFVDNHLHASFQMSRGLADEANAQSFLFDHMYPYEGAMTEEDVYTSSSLAAIELLRHGVTCFVDPGNYHPDATVRAIAASGLRMVVATSCFDKTKSVLGLLPESMIETTASCLAKTEKLFDKYRSGHGGRITTSASFRGLNNASDELILGLKRLSEKYGTFLQ
ncbi:MAG: amidohydrolase family protein, partial [Betaproteobacteria bacterium]|nr:amidohydrolase family protein [Betaproteobacteria bacterium]